MAEQKLVSEVRAFERAGPSGKLHELVSGITHITQGKKEIIPAEDRFLIEVDALCRQYNSENIASITQEDINNILEKSQLVPGLKYKNPTAYILGFLATKGGRTIDVSSVRHVIDDILPQIGKEAGVTPPDIVRYSRMWYLMLK